jgi:hypothetical protein
VQASLMLGMIGTTTLEGRTPGYVLVDVSISHDVIPPGVGCGDGRYLWLPYIGGLGAEELPRLLQVRRAGRSTGDK